MITREEIRIIESRIMKDFRERDSHSVRKRKARERAKPKRAEVPALLKKLVARL